MKSQIQKAVAIIVVLAMLPQISKSQTNTIGLISYNPNKSFSGYNLLYPHNQPNVFLFNNCGQLINVWEGEENERPGNVAELLMDGRIVIAKRFAAVNNDPIWAGGGGATIDIRDWENNIDWTYTLNNEKFRLHHDFSVIEKENGFTLLLLTWEKKTYEEAIQAGRRPDLLIENELLSEYIFEIDPKTDEILWEWHVWDHLVQEYDEQKDNYGVVADHPELININYDFGGTGKADWLHMNAIDYNADLNQVLVSSPEFSEIWIIDKSTNSEESTLHAGGNSGLGGDLLFRWGNDSIYHHGGKEDQKFFYQHNAQWIDDFIESDNDNYGKISVFNNRYTQSTSVGSIIAPVFDPLTLKYEYSTSFKPDSYERTIVHPRGGEAMHSEIVSNVQYLPNDNILICSGQLGYAFELTPTNEIVWEYIVPINGGKPVEQGNNLDFLANLTFEVRRYPLDFEGFIGKDMTPGELIELNGNLNSCKEVVTTVSKLDFFGVSVYPNPSNSSIYIDLGSSINDLKTIKVFDLLGKEVYFESFNGNSLRVNVVDWKSGIYVLKIESEESKKVTRILIQK